MFAIPSSSGATSSDSFADWEVTDTSIREYVSRNGALYSQHVNQEDFLKALDKFLLQSDKEDKFNVLALFFNGKIGVLPAQDREGRWGICWTEALDIETSYQLFFYREWDQGELETHSSHGITSTTINPKTCIQLLKGHLDQCCLHDLQSEDLYPQAQANLDNLQIAFKVNHAVQSYFSFLIKTNAPFDCSLRFFVFGSDVQITLDKKYFLARTIKKEISTEDVTDLIKMNGKSHEDSFKLAIKISTFGKAALARCSDGDATQTLNLQASFSIDVGEGTCTYKSVLLKRVSKYSFELALDFDLEGAPGSEWILA